MKRDIDTLFSQDFDIAIVGGGIYGATLAYKAVNSGYRVTLIEKEEFGGGTSANTLGTLHGGLRYLQHLDLRRIRESTQSRKFFLQFSPQTIDITPFLIPMRGLGMKGPLVLQAGLIANGLISADRNRGVDKTKRIPIGQIVSKKYLTEIIGEKSAAKANSGGLWYEAIMNDPQGLVNELVDAAHQQGACCINQLEAASLQLTSSKVAGLNCVDLTNNQPGTIKTKLVIDTTGINIGDLSKGLKLSDKTATQWCRGVNMIVDRPLFDNKTAIGLPYRDKLQDKASKASDGERFIFFVPLQNRTLVGTFYQHQNEVDDRFSINADDKKKYLKKLNQVFSGKPITEKDVYHWHSGWLPLSEQTNDLDLAKDHKIHCVENAGEQIGLIEVTGVKFTTAPTVADEVLALIESQK